MLVTRDHDVLAAASPAKRSALSLPGMPLTQTIPADWPWCRRVYPRMWLIAMASDRPGPAPAYPTRTIVLVEPVWITICLKALVWCHSAADGRDFLLK